MSSVLFERCRQVITMDDEGAELQDVSIGVRDGWITYMGSDPVLSDYERRESCDRFLVLPGLVNTHHHLYQMLTRGFPQRDGSGLFGWLKMLYPIWAGLDQKMVYASTRAGLAELLLNGCTTSADHLYVFPQGSEVFIDVQVEAAREIGVRFHPTRGSMDLGQSHGGLPPDSITQPAEVILRDSERVIATYHDPRPGSMIRVGLAPCSPFSATPELMRESAALAREKGVRLHTHLAETRDEEEYSRENFGLTPADLLTELGWMEPDVWLAHCVHLSTDAIHRLSVASVSVAHCPTSNMLLGSGLAPTRALLDAGVSVGLGVDGSASNDSNAIELEVKQAVLSARARDGAAAMSVREAVRMATRGGATCLGRDDLGCIAPGKVADLALFDLDALACAGSSEDWLAGIVLGGARPNTVVVQGETLVRDGHLTRDDETKIAAELNRQSRRLLTRAA